MNASRRGHRALWVAINGACGRMGREIAALALSDGGWAIGAALEGDGHPALGCDYGGVLGGALTGLLVANSLKDARVDVLVDFSLPAATVRRLRECAVRRVPMVIGTTGLDARSLRAMRRAARRIAVVQAPNMSVGVNALLQVLPRLARLLGPDYDLEIVEAHHRLKRDAPSGTALALAEAAARALGRDVSRDAVYGRRGDACERPRGAVGIHAVRAGDIAGEHRVLFGGPGETVEVIHRAGSRQTFARGALRAARFAASARPGLYGMADVLGAGP